MVERSTDKPLMRGFTRRSAKRKSRRDRMRAKLRVIKQKGGRRIEPPIPEHGDLGAGDVGIDVLEAQVAPGLYPTAGSNLSTATEGNPGRWQVRPLALALKPALRGRHRGAQHHAAHDVAGAQVI
jgi:hypothetical protein